MSSENKKCVNCNQEFTIESDDFAFYKKIDVPAPTWCPDCRQRRRYAWRNERTLYLRDCDLCKKKVVSIYHPDSPYTVYCVPCWWGDKWDGYQYGQDYDPNRSFFEQWHELQLKAPRLALLSKNSVDSPYTNHSSDNKSCYLCFSVFNGEEILHSTNLYDGEFRRCVDCYHGTKNGELLYECVDGEKNYKCQFTYQLRNCSDCYYCFDCNNCNNCLLSWNLRNKSYCILNKQYSKEEYQKKIKEYKLDTHSGREELYKQWRELMEKEAIHRFAILRGSHNATGNMIKYSRNIHDSFDVDDTENTRDAVISVDNKDSMDSYHYGWSELIHESHGVTRSYNLKFTHICYDDSHVEYCDTCHNSENLFGCAGLNKGQYAILNKKYSKEEYEKLRAQIISDMKERGEYGEFFPMKMAPVSYNETQAMVYMPMTKEEVLAKGWKWEENMPGIYGKETLQPEDLPESIAGVDESILKEALKCTECDKNYNLVALELQFYQNEGIPVPRLCPDCRYQRRINLRAPRKLWTRTCMKEGCNVEFQTTYAPDRPEQVYCEKCYQDEVV